MQDRVFYNLLLEFATQSKCLKYNVGAFIVKDGRIISTGYNGTPHNFEECLENEKWHSTYEVHAEQNAIVFAANHGININNSVLYVTHLPCFACSKLIIQSGIKEVKYIYKYVDPLVGKNSLEFLKKNNIKVTQLNFRKFIFIFVGPDGTGKTEIAKKLAEKLNLTYFKFSQEDKNFKGENINILKYGGQMLLDLVKSLKTGIILDRGHPCEWVYSKVFNRKTDENFIKYLDEEYAKLGSIIIFCTRDKKSIKNYSDNLVDLKKFDLINKFYKKFFKITKCKVITCRTDSEDLRDELNQIFKNLFLK